MENENEKLDTSKKDFSQEIAPEVKKKMKMNLVYVGMFSVAMVFAGLTSGYIVSMGDSIWVKFPLPKAFWISTIIIILSSITFQLTVLKANKDNHKTTKLLAVTTLILGLLFVYFQFKGYGQLIDKGSHLVGNIMTVEGRYGSVGEDGRYYGYYELKYKGKFIGINGNDYLLNGKKMSDSDMKTFQEFMLQFEKMNLKNSIKIKNPGNNFELFYKQQPLTNKEGKLILPDGKSLQYVDLMRLQSLAVNVGDGRGDFFINGEIGKDFQVYYKGKELEYENREWKYKGQRLDDYLQTKPLESPDTSSSYLYVITFLHLLHIIGTIFYLLKVVKISISNTYTFENKLSIKLGAIFWHFLGLLWLYLLLFLLFIH
jgi:cytochrome c oxidase subunit 3